MATRPVVIAVICIGLFLIFQSLVPKALALRTSNVNDIKIEDQRTHKRRNYMWQRARDKEILESLDNVRVTYDAEPSESGRNPEKLSDFIVDYANMIDDVILLDKSVETRTSKRGNIKLKTRNDQSILDPPCSCKTVKKSLVLGKKSFPTRINISTCDNGQQDGCVTPYICQSIKYNVTILTKKTDENANSSITELPNNLRWSWIAEMKEVSVGCECKRDYIY